jgi:hypothetical protein
MLERGVEKEIIAVLNGFSDEVDDITRKLEKLKRFLFLLFF